MVDNGCRGIVTPGSLGEGNTMSLDEQGRLWKTVVRAVDDRVPVVAAISALSTAEAVEMAELARNRGCCRSDGPSRPMSTRVTGVR
jgi:4-hydroxy-tetrahydrodipicolinate synthase